MQLERENMIKEAIVAKPTAPIGVASMSGFCPPHKVKLINYLIQSIIILIGIHYF